MVITSIYAGLLAILLALLSTHVVNYRRRMNMLIGDCDDKQMLQRIRAHGNFIEYAPMALVLLALTELQNVGAFWVHVYGIALVLGRLFHAIGFLQTPQNLVLRQVGMILTLPVMVIMGIGLIVRSVFG